MKIHGTAKGGALSKKDFGVAFSAPASYVYEQTEQDNRYGTFNNKYFGVNLTNSYWYDKNVTRIDFYFKKDGGSAATSTIKLAHAASDGSITETDLGSVTASFDTTTLQQVSFTGLSVTLSGSGGYLFTYNYPSTSGAALNLHIADDGSQDPADATIAPTAKKLDDATTPVTFSDYAKTYISNE